MRTRLAVTVTAAILAAPAAAQAAPIALGSGSTPGVAVDDAGTAYLAWNGSEPGSPPHFCRLPRGATACDVATTMPIAADTDTLSRPFVRVSGGRVDIVVHRYGPQSAILAYSSTDRGVGFGAPRVVGGHVPFVEAVAGPGETLSVASSADNRGALVQNMPLDGPAPTTLATLFDISRPYLGTVGLDGATPLAIFTTGASIGAFRRYAGSGDLNAQANWGPPVDIGYLDYPRLAGGPSGLFVLAGDESGGLFVRRWDGATFGPRVTLTTSGDASEMSLFQDASGRLHAVYPRGSADGWHVEHATSDDGTAWQVGTVALQTDDEPFSMRAATAPDHVGVVVWSSRVAGVHQIRLSAIGPGSPVPPTQPPPVQPPPPAADPVPQFNQTVVVRPVRGVVRVRLRGSNRFVNLTSIDDIPFGATIDTRRGEVELRSVASRTGPVQSVRLRDGWFRVAFSRGITNFTLNEPLARCSRRGSAAQRKRKSRKLWGEGSGKFRTTGNYSAATVRGTRWLVQDTCAGTRTRVTQGIVAVRDRVRKRTVVIRGPRGTYLARPRR